MKFLILGTLTALLCFYAYTQDNEQQKSYRNDLDEQYEQINIQQKQIQQIKKQNNPQQIVDNEFININEKKKQTTPTSSIGKKINEQKIQKGVQQKRSSSVPKDMKQNNAMNIPGQDIKRQKEIRRQSQSLQANTIKNTGIGAKNSVKVRINNNTKNDKVSGKYNKKDKEHKNNGKGKLNSNLNTKGNKYQKLNMKIFNTEKNTGKYANSNKKNNKYVTSL